MNRSMYRREFDSIAPALTTGAAAGDVAQNIPDTLITMDGDQKVMEILPFVGVMSQVRVEAMSTGVHDFKPGPDVLTGTAMNDAWVET